MFLKLVGASRKLRTKVFDKIKKASQIRWKFKFQEVNSPGAKLTKARECFKLWMLTNDYQTVKDFEGMNDSAFKKNYDGEILIYKLEEGEYKFYKKT